MSLAGLIMAVPVYCKKRKSKTGARVNNELRYEQYIQTSLNDKETETRLLSVDKTLNVSGQ